MMSKRPLSSCQAGMFSVLHAHQAQPLCRRRGSSQPPVASFQNVHHITRREFAATYLDERAYDVAHHVMKKPVATNLVGKNRGSRSPKDTRSKNLAYGVGWRLWRNVIVRPTRARKRSKVMTTLDQAGGFRHAPAVERVRIGVDKARDEGGADL